MRIAVSRYLPGALLALLGAGALATPAVAAKPRSAAVEAYVDDVVVTR